VADAGIAISFNVKKRIGQKAWRTLHYFSYLVFGMVTVHALGAGTDAAKIGMRVMAFGYTGALLLLTIFYLRAMRAGNAPKPVKVQGNPEAASPLDPPKAEVSPPTTVPPVVRRRSTPANNSG
jgi:predicted ferric reductase